MPQALSPPALISLKVSPPPTATGVSRRVMVPSPSWLSPLSPQHQATLLLSMAQVWLEVFSKVPAAVIRTKLCPPATCTGTALLLVVPSPSDPVPLLPQHQATP